MLIALLDADPFIHRAALKMDVNVESVVKRELDKCVLETLRKVGCTHYRIFVGSGASTFRNALTTTYKEDRVPTPHKELFRQHLIDEFGAIKCIGYEADDALAMEQNETTILVHDDKDMLQIPGRQYITELWRNGKQLRPGKFIEISEIEGLRTVYAQALIGDPTDNIEGIAGIGKVKATQIVRNYNTEKELFDIIRIHYSGDERFFMNMNLLWLWRKYGEKFTNRIEIKGWV